MNYCIDCNTRISNGKYTRCKSCAGKINIKNSPIYGRKGWRHKPETIENMRIAKLGIRNHRFGKVYTKEEIEKYQSYGMWVGQKMEENPNWQNGKSFEIYPKEFDDILKAKIRKRDNYTCQICSMTEEESLIVYGEVLHTHHIDYDKNNCNEANLCSACRACNARVNYNRTYWQDTLQTKIMGNNQEVINETKII